MSGDYVYALHDFVPEHEDEISFRTGERIEVIERDDVYSDGWWQGRNAAGQTGLFPQSYTAPNPPETPLSARTPTVSTALQPLQEDDEPAESIKDGGNDSAVMAATLTDVQDALDQLGDDGARSFSFASTRADSEDQLSEDGTDDNDHDDAWRVEARRALAEKAQREMERREAQEKAYSPRASLPPIHAEISDESEGEDDISPSSDHHLHSAATPRTASYPVSHTVSAPEPETVREPEPQPEPQPEPPQAPAPAPSSPVLAPSSPVPPRRSPTPPRSDKSALLTHTRDASTLSLPTPSSDASLSPRGSTSSHSRQPSLTTPSVTASSIPTTAEVSPTPVSTTPVSAIRTSGGLAAFQAKTTTPTRPGSGAATRTQSYSSIPMSSPRTQEYSSHSRTSTDMAAALPSPAASSVGTQGYGNTFSSTIGAQRTSAQSWQQPSLSTSASGSVFVTNVHPSEWSVEQVVAWLRSKGFDEAVCSKFIEHEITGDVLLDLDANLLKELDIAAFGKRMRIANAIHELQRPPSIVSSENSASRLNQQQQQQMRHQSGQSQPGVSPLMTSLISPESPPHSGDVAGTPDRRSQPSSEPGTAQSASVVGLGFQTPDRNSNSNSANGKGVRPAALNLNTSPSDSALKARAALADQILEDLHEERTVDERAVMSEGETAEGLEQRTNKRRKASKDEPPASASTSASLALSTSSKEKEGKSKRSISVDISVRPDKDGQHSGGGGGRLSFFGGTLSNRSRKPPPRLASTEGENTAVSTPPAGAEKEKNRTLSRLHFGSSSKRPTSRSGAPVALTDSESANLSVNTLRKRTVSATDTNASGSTRGKAVLKPGMSIVDQIGDPDYSGWMRKRGERYNTWKLRYFVLKGPHLYYLRSRNETKLKGYINIVGYKVIADENANPGRYGFRIIHDTDKPHYFSSEEQMVVREWMKAIMKATIDRDYTRPVISSCNIPTIPLTIAQAMNPAPRPPSPGAREATQRAMRRENPNQLSSRDARVLMGLPNNNAESTTSGERRLESFFETDSISPPVSPTAAPPRPKRESRNKPRTISDPTAAEDAELIRWINGHLPESLHVNDLSTSLSTGLVLFRLAEAIKGRPSQVPDSVFPSSSNDDRLEGLFKLFDFLLDNDVKTGSVSINDVRQGRRDKIVQLVRSLKGWEDKRLAIAKSVGVGAVVAGQWVS